MGSLILRSKRPAAAAAAACNSLLGCISAGILRSPHFVGSELVMSSVSSRSASAYLFGSARKVSTIRRITSDKSPSKMSPWLMLPPAFEGGGLVYRFYNLKDDKIESYRKRRKEEEGPESVEEMPDDDAEFVGSSHGWLALFNQRNNDLFLSNPLSGRHIKLPPIDTLPDPRINLSPDGRGCVSKVTLSSSPDEEDCRAMMSFGPGCRLAFCLPGRSTEWAPIGDLYYRSRGKTDGEEAEFWYGRAYEDFVYCSSRKLFSCITQFEMDLEYMVPNIPCELDDWDLGDPRSPSARTCHWMGMLEFKGGENCSWLTENRKLLELCRQIPYVVYAEEFNQLFIVTRFVMDRIHPDRGSYVQVDEIPYDPGSNRLMIDKYPHKTIGFSVLKVGYKKEILVDSLTLLDGGGSLDGLAMFIGRNHSIAVSAAEFGKLKPNSIYFTDANKHASSSIYGGHDIGIFDYENKTITPYYYPCDAQSFKKIVPPPMWFTPEPLSV